MSVLQALVQQYDRLAARGEVPTFGFSREGISYAVELSSNGEFVDVTPLLDTSDKTPRPSLHEVPQRVKRASGIEPNFLWDKTAYTFGVKRDKSKQRILAVQEQTAFREFHERLLRNVNDKGLEALLAFLSGWRAERFAELPGADDLLDTNVVFRLQGEQEFIHERPVAKECWLKHLDQKASAGDQAVCLVSGEQAPVARLHPAVKGVRGAKTSGGSVVSFNCRSFESFNKSQGANAPVSERVAFAYTASLNKLLELGSRNRIQVGDATTIFWAEAAGEEQDASAAEELFALLAEPPTDAEEEAKVADRLKAIGKGRPLAEFDPKLHEDTRFFVLGLAPAAARIHVRYWHVDTIGEIARRVSEHWLDLMFEPSPTRTRPSANRLLRETALLGKYENIPPMLGGALMRSILHGYNYPRSLLAAVVMRIRAGGQLSGLQAAIAKACIRRAERLRDPNKNKEDRLVSLDVNSESAAYNLGRLFAAYAYAERSLADRNATIRDKYMGAASATPRRVFPILMRGYENNRAGLAKAGGQRRGAGKRADQAVGQIMERLPGGDELPTTLSLEDQARFFVGYYHQERVFFTKSESDPELDHSIESEE